MDESLMVDEYAPASRPGLTQWAVKAAWLAGLLVAAYLTVEHFTASATLVCSSGAVVNCQQVTTSSYSLLFGVPVALLGLLYFVAGGIFGWLLAPRWPAGRVHAAGTLLTGVGVGFVLYLVWAEMQLGQICSWCTVIHVLIVGLFVYYLTSLLLARMDA